MTSADQKALDTLNAVKILKVDPDHKHTIVGPRSKVNAHIRQYSVALWLRANGKATLFFSENGKRRQKTWARFTFVKSN